MGEPSDANHPRDTAPRNTAELERLLADRERRITELTDQLLGALDQLTESRRDAAGRRQTQQLLHDAQRRLQRAGRTTLALEGAPPATFEVVCWQAGGGPGWSAADLGRVAAKAGGSPVVWVGPEDRLPEATDGVRQHAGGDCRTPVEAWNEAMAATTAPWVWLLAPGSDLAEGTTAAVLSPADADPVAAMAPHLTLAETAHCGMVDPTDSLRFEPGKPVQEPGRSVPSVAPELFAVRRAAFEVLGPFDRELRGGLAAADWCLRAGYEGFRVLAQPGLQGTAQPLPSGQDLRDRPLLMARHRRDQLAGALAELPVWRELTGQPLREFTVVLLNRLGVAPHTRDLLVPVLLQLAGKGN